MCVPEAASYPLVGELLKVVLAGPQATRLAALTDGVWALLAAQSLHPADLARALPRLRTGRARQALRRVRRLLGRAVLGSGVLSPLLIRAALALVPAGEVDLVLDSTRCGGWELFTLGVRLGGRVLPVGWSVLPYPWPKRRFTPTVVALLERTLAAWPAERAVHLLADRGFPSLPLFRCLERQARRRPLRSTIRLRAGDWVWLAAGRAVRVADLETGLAAGEWRCLEAAYQKRGRCAAPALLVVGRGAVEPPLHQRGPGDVARRAVQQARRLAHVRSKHQPHAAESDRVWALLSTAPTAEQAVARYACRFSTEGTYRDLKSWDLELVARHERDASHLDGLLGLAALGYLAQSALGVQAGRADDLTARARQQQWSTTDRLCAFWRGRQLLHDHAHDWSPWLQTQLPRLLQRFRAATADLPATLSPACSLEAA